MNAFDLFSGIGGFRSGIAAAFPGTNFTGFCEHDPYAIKAYEAMYDTRKEIHVPDLLNVTRSSSGGLASLGLIRRSVPTFDILTAGMPCQPHSLMGNRLGHEDDRGALVYDTLRLIEAMRPDFIMLENVRGFLSVNDGSLYRAILERLTALHYYSVTWMLDAAHHGLPQVRRRVFIVASKKMLAAAPPLTRKLNTTTWHILERNVGDKYYLSERILGTILKDTHKGYSRKADINRLIARPLTRTMHKMHRASQDNYYSDDFLLGRYDAATCQVRPASTAVRRIRRLTPRESLMLQGFAKTTIERIAAVGLSDSRLYMLAGNAVPQQMVHAAAQHALNRTAGGRDVV